MKPRIRRIRSPIGVLDDHPRAPGGAGRRGNKLQRARINKRCARFNSAKADGRSRFESAFPGPLPVVPPAIGHCRVEISDRERWAGQLHNRQARARDHEQPVPTLIEIHHALW